MDTLVELAPGLWQLPLLPLHGLNVYLVGDVVVDAGLPSSKPRLLEALAGRRVTAHVLTHAHPDHQGASAALCSARSIPLWCGARDLTEGDAVADFEVIETPGHTPGHISLWRESDRVVVLGDVASHRNPLAMRLGLRESSRLFTYDSAENRRSIRKIAALRPRLVCFGHGPPLADGDRFARWADAL